MVEHGRIPIVVLAGSDGRASRLPEAGRDKHPLSGFKGVDVRIDGRPLVACVVERLRASGRFDPVYLVGPAKVYSELCTIALLVDSDGSFGENIERAVERVRRDLPGRPVGFTVCDILPEVETLRALMDDFERHAPCDLWFPVIHAPEDRTALGASAWKPKYRIVPQAGQAAVEVLPGHLAVADLDALRLDFLYQLFQLGYQTRNRPIEYRRGAMARGLLFGLLGRDLQRLLRLRLPSVTWTVLRAGIRAARRLSAGTITRAGLEDGLTTLLIRSQHRRANPGRRVHLPIVEGLSLALDIDTEEEARQMGGDVSSRSA